MLLVAAVLCEQLGSPEWVGREAAESALREMGPAAWPVVLLASRSEDAEVRARCDRLLAPHRARVLLARAEECLYGPWPPSPMRFWEDVRLRERVYRLAVEAGCPDGWADPIHPDYWADRVGWFTDQIPVLDCHRAMLDCREHLGVRPPWFLR